MLNATASPGSSAQPRIGCAPRSASTSGTSSNVPSSKTSARSSKKLRGMYHVRLAWDAATNSSVLSRGTGSSGIRVQLRKSSKNRPEPASPPPSIARSLGSARFCSTPSRNRATSASSSSPRTTQAPSRWNSAARSSFIGGTLLSYAGEPRASAGP
jgi:hypothetical protein